MDTSLEPPTKKARLETFNLPPIAQALSLNRSPENTMLQKLKAILLMAEDNQDTWSYPLYTRIEKKLTIFNIDGREFLAINSTPKKFQNGNTW